MDERLLFLFRSHLRGFAGIEADENNFVVAPGIERKHAQCANDALFDLIAKHGAAVVYEGEDHGLLLAEVIAKLDTATSFVAEREVQRHGPVERRLETHVLQGPRHGRSRWGGAAGDRLRVQSASREQARGNPGEMAKFIHCAISFSP